MFRFIIKTAKEFATRQVNTTIQSLDRIIAAKISGLSILPCRASEAALYANEPWTRLPYDNDGESVFRKADGRGFLYFRASTKRWYFDNDLNYTGACLAESATSDIHSEFTINSGDTRSANTIVITAVTSTDPFAYANEAIEITGCDLLQPGSSCSATENGIYLRCEPQENLNGKPLYLKRSLISESEHDMRYVYMTKNGSWVCSTNCTGKEALFFNTTRTENPIGRTFYYFPPLAKETNLKVTNVVDLHLFESLTKSSQTTVLICHARGVRTDK